MMADFLIGIGFLGMGMTGLAFRGHIRSMISRIVFTEADKKRMVLAGMNGIELRTEYAHASAACMVCASKGDRRGVRHARRYMELITGEILGRAERTEMIDVLH
jgi:hypothetical protein